MQLIDVAIGTEEQFASGAPQSLLGLASTDGQMLQGDSLLVRLPEVALSDTDALPQLYFRTAADGEEVPTSIDGQLLTATSHALLPDAVRGAVRYFRIAGEELAEVDRRGLRRATARVPRTRALLPQGRRIWATRRFSTRPVTRSAQPSTTG